MRFNDYRFLFPYIYGQNKENFDQQIWKMFC